MESNLQPGTYRGSADGLTFEFRVEAGPAGGVRMVSGDITRDGEFVATFHCTEPRLDLSEQSLEGPISFRGNDRLFTGRLKLQADERGIGTFEVGVDVQGGFRDYSVGRLDWQGEYMRRLVIEIDGIDGTQPPPDFVGAGGRRVSIERAFEDAGFDVTVNVDPFRGRGPGAATVRGFTPAEIHAAMQEMRSGPPAADRLHVHVFVCSYLAEDRDVLGLMYDWEADDLNRRPREGVAVFYDHPMLSDPRIPEDLRRREYVFTTVHEIGHALNLLHSFDKARPSSLSWMNYPDLFPYGHERPQGYDGTSQFWRRFPEAFDDEEMRHLRHGSPREVAAGGFAFGAYEEGTSWVLGGTADPRRTVLGANPLRSIADVELRIATHRREYSLGEPVFLRLEVHNSGTQHRLIPKALDPAEGYVKLSIRRPDGRAFAYRPPMRFCKQAQMVTSPPGGEPLVFDGAPIFLSAEGPVFTEPGTYLLQADLTGVDGSRVVSSRPAAVRIAVPDRDTERFAERAWTDARQGLRALYLRHPLALKEGFDALEALARETGLDRRATNTTWSYLNFIAGMGWLTPFTPLHGRREMGVEPGRARDRFGEVREDDLDRLPGGVRRRRDDLLKEEEGDGRRSALVRLRPRERARAAVPPSGLFGTLGLEAGAAEVSTDPFKRVVPGLRGTRAFADVVSWNIEHLHDRGRWEKIPRVAELIRSFRCDFWGLQEVDEASLAELVNAINAVGRTRYAYHAVPGSGQQNGLLYRTDTTRVQLLPADPELFGGRLEVELKAGGKAERPVFHRPPLLADVRVVQEGGSFDFRCAVVHLKSTDGKLADTGSGLRAAAAEALARWIERDRRKSGGERDYVVLGDMNAETAAQGLAPFAGEGLSLLSVGMQDRYGRDQALTRVASGRFLDHIVVTADAKVDVPEEDLAEQLVVRSDTELGAWTEEYSDHLPVAVRFVLGDDDDGGAALLAARLARPGGLLAFTARTGTDRASVEAAVLHTLAVMSGVPRDLLRPDHTLAVALGMTGPKRRALAQPFQTIARRSNPGAAVAPGECEALKTVGECVGFVASKAGLS